MALLALIGCNPFKAVRCARPARVPLNSEKEKEELREKKVGEAGEGVMKRDAGIFGIYSI